jgi:hypothetical protein
MFVILLLRYRLDCRLTDDCISRVFRKFRDIRQFAQSQLQANWSLVYIYIIHAKVYKTSYKIIVRTVILLYFSFLD